MGLLKKIVRAYSKGGVSGLGMTVARRAGVGGKSSQALYQEKVAPSTDLRWSMICSQITPATRNLLDIGSNLGDFTALSAKAGMWSVGAEISAQLVLQAQKRHGTVPNCGFLVSALDLRGISKLPTFDVVLLLSVHHHWHMQYGPSIAAEMLNAIVEKTNTVVIFEGPSRTTRYMRDIPEFIDNDEVSVVAYYSAFLAASVGHLVKSIECLGKSPCVGDREPHRWMYALRK